MRPGSLYGRHLSYRAEDGTLNHMCPQEPTDRHVAVGQGGCLTWIRSPSSESPGTVGCVCEPSAVWSLSPLPFWPGCLSSTASQLTAPAFLIPLLVLPIYTAQARSSALLWTTHTHTLSILRISQRMATIWYITIYCDTISKEILKVHKKLPYNEHICYIHKVILDTCCTVWTEGWTSASFSKRKGAKKKKNEQC